MGIIKTQITKRAKEAGGKNKARQKAEEWFIRSRNKFNEKQVLSTRKKFIPGKIYVFKYLDPKYKDTLPWWDSNPVVLAIYSELENDFGINLNLLPIEPKEQLLDVIYDRLKNEIKSQTTGRKSSNAQQQSALTLKYDSAKGMLKKFGYDFALRQYIPSRKRTQTVVAYENWPDIALCDFVEINGDSIYRIKREFKNHLKR